MLIVQVGYAWIRVGAFERFSVPNSIKISIFIRNKVIRNLTFFLNHIFGSVIIFRVQHGSIPVKHANHPSSHQTNQHEFHTYESKWIL